MTRAQGITVVLQMVCQATCNTAARHSTAQHSTTWHGMAWHSTAQQGTQHGTAQHSIVKHSTAQHSTAQHMVAVQQPSMTSDLEGKGGRGPLQAAGHPLPPACPAPHACNKNKEIMIKCQPGLGACGAILSSPCCGQLPAMHTYTWSIHSQHTMSTTPQGLHSRDSQSVTL